MRRLVVPLLLVAIITASFPASLVLIFIRGIVVSTANASGSNYACATDFSACGDGMCDGCGLLPSYFGGVSSNVGGSGFMSGLLFAHAITTHDVLPPSRYPMVIATASIVASTTTTMTSSSSPSSSSGGMVGIIPSVMAESSHSRGGSSSNHKPRKARSTPGPGQQSPGSPLRQQQPELAAEVGGGGGGNAAYAPHQPQVTEAPPDTLKVTVLGQLRGKSPSCAYSLVELINTHHADTIVLHSTYIEPTVIFPPGLSSNHSASTNGRPISSSLNFNAEYDPDRHMHIPPQTSITIPVSIIPHWRKPPEDLDNLHRRTRLCNNLSFAEDGVSSATSTALESEGCLSIPSTMDTAETSTNNIAIDADILDMIASSKTGYLRQPQTGEEQVQMLAGIFDTLVVNTSWGIVQMKVPYTCSPQSSIEYEFSLPNNLMFLDGGGGWYARRNTTPPSSSATLHTSFLYGDWESTYPNMDAFNPFIHRVYMNNPTDSELRIWEVYTTKPNLVDVEMQMQYVVPSWSSPLLTTMDVKDFYPLRGKGHPPKQNNIYVSTLRLLPLNFTMEMTCAMQDLGFLVVRTNLGTFSISLDFIPNSGRAGPVHGTFIVNGSSLDEIHLVQDYAIGKLVPPKINSTTTRPSMFTAKSYHAKDIDSDMRQPNQLHAIDAINDATNSPLLTATPSKIDFGTITTGSRIIRIPLNLTNHHTNPLRVMRISVVMNVNANNVNGKVADLLNKNNIAEVGVDFTDGTEMMRLDEEYGDSYVFTRNFFLSPSIPSESPLQIWCRFNASSHETVKERFYTGSILIYTSEMNSISSSYRSWERKVLLGLSALGRKSWGGTRNLSAQYSLEIPFQGSVLLGNLGSRTESLLFPTRFSNLPVEERDIISKGTNGKFPEYYDRNIEITNNFAVPITIIGMRVLDSHGGRVDNGYCSSRFSFNSEAPEFFADGSSPRIAESGEIWKDLLIRYRFIDDDFSDGLNVFRKCILSLETDRAGKQSLPLIIYSGDIFVDVEWPDHEGKVPNHCILTKADGSTMTSRSGLPCMKNWIKSSVEGTILQKALQNQLSVAQQSQHMNNRIFGKYLRKCTTTIVSDPIECYFRSFLPGSALDSDPTQYSLQPVVMPFGAINAGESRTLSLFLTNLNHVPIDIMATTAAIGNMNVTIGVVPSLLHDSFERMMNSPGKGEVAYVLRNSPVAKDLFSRFTYQFDISPSTRARGSELLSLFQRKMMIDTFQNVSEYLTNYVEREEMKIDNPNGFLLSVDGTFEKIFESRQIGKKAWTIPPGGVARFNVVVSAPVRSELMNDVTQFVGTGLVLQTNHGQALPLVLTFSALAGQLQLTPSFDPKDIAGNKQPNGEKATSLKQLNTTSPPAVNVPLTLADPSIAPSVTSFIQRRGAPISLESTFRHDLYLSDIRSCNRWFSVIPYSNNEAGFISNLDPNDYLRIEGVENEDGDYSADERLLNRTILPLGRVMSTLACSHPSSDTSFFACALAWLENRDRIQPPGCGLTEEDVVTQWMSNAAKSVKRRISLDSRINSAKSNAIRALRDVVAFLSARYVNEIPDNSGAESKMAYVHSSRIRMFEHARKMWNEVGALGLNVITGQINAKTICFTESISEKSNNATDSSEDIISTHESNNGPRGTPLAIPVSSVLLQSKLEFPNLFLGGEFDVEDSFGVVDFGIIHVADTAFRHISIVNPTAMTIRVRLAAVGGIDGSVGEDAESHHNIHVQNTPDDHHPWWTGGSYWMPDDQGHLIVASHNVTVKSGAGAFISLLNPALHTMSAFVLGCGKRCGIRNEYDPNGEGINYSPIGSASGDGSKLLGRPSSETHHENKTPKQVLGMNSPQPFSFVRPPNDVYIEPYGAAELGPVYFRPPGRGEFESNIYIENSLTGFEEVTVRGRGGWENLVFLDQISGHTGEVEFRFGKSTLVFPGSHLRRGGKGMGPVVKSVRLANHGDFPIDITSVHMASSEVVHFTNKRRHPSSASSSTQRCSERGFALPGCDDSISSFWLVESLSSWFNAVVDLFQKHNLDSTPELRKRKRQPDHSFYKNGFTLRPNQTQTIFVMHYPDCVFRTSYSSVIFELGDGLLQQSVGNRLGSRQQTFRRRQVELLVGYDMSSSEFRQCVPYTPPESSIRMWEREFVFRLTSLVQDVLTFGLTRLTDKNGNPYIPRLSIEMTILVALLMLLLVALSLDLILAADLSSIPKFLPAWKPTCRCLARADPTASDLLSLGKEQTKHVLLSRYRREGALPSNCVQLDGSFSREKVGFNGSGTHSEAIFDHLNLVNESKTTEGDGNETIGLLPCGLGWRTAMKRGIGLPPPETHLLARSLRVVNKLQEQKVATCNISNTPVVISASTLSTSTSPQAHGLHVNGNSTFANFTDKSVTAPKQNVEVQVEENIPAPDTMRENAPNDEPKQLDLSSTEGGDPFNRIENREHRKLMHKHKSDTRETSVVRTEQNGSVVDAKVKQKQRDEAMGTKNERVNRTEIRRDTPKHGESNYNPDRAQGNQNSRPAKSATGLLVLNGKQVDRERNDQKKNASQQRKELPANQSKTRQTKKAINGTKACEEQEGKQCKSNGASKEAVTLNSRKYPVPTEKPPARRSLADAEPQISQHAHAPQARTPIRQIANVRPPPGLLAPPGFSGQPDLEGVSSQSSPSSSHQRLSSHRTPEIQLMPASIEISNTPPPPQYSDFLTFLGSESVTLENSVFQLPLPINDNSPRTFRDNEIFAPALRSQTYTPPVIETAPSVESNNGGPPDVQAILGSGSNFNVSNFLNGILSESTQYQPSPSRNIVQNQAEVAEPDPLAAMVVGVSLDPWNNSDHSTNINPLDIILQSVTNDPTSSPIIVGVPLESNSSSHLNFPTTEFYSELAYARNVSDEGEDSDSLEPDSFYNQLLGED